MLCSRLKRLSALLFFVSVSLLSPAAGAAEPSKLAPIQTVIVIYQENWSFDSLYGSFPGANGLSSAGSAAIQMDLSGTAYGSPAGGSPAGMPIFEPRVVQALGMTPPATAHLPNGPFDLATYLSPSAKTVGDPSHRYYLEQLQIDGGRMDRYVAWSSVSGLAMSGFDGSQLPEGLLARQYTLCDNFFHGAFGGSFFNHLWLVSAQPVAAPVVQGVAVCEDSHGNYQAVTAAGQATGATPSAAGPATDLSFTRDSRWAVNTIMPPYAPRPTAGYYLAPLTTTTIGDLLSRHGVAWKWYSGAWDAAIANTATASSADGFQFHHQSFNYWAEFAPGSVSRAAHLADETQFFSDLSGHSLPAVSFIKATGNDDEHPSYASLAQGQQHVAHLVAAVQKSPYWKHALIIITYDEHGGRWDHVAPPGSALADAGLQAYVAANPARADQWGPGTRVPTLLISPYAKRGYVDHTPFDSTSILTLLEDRFCGGARLGTRDAAVNSLGLSLAATAQKSVKAPDKVQK